MQSVDVDPRDPFQRNSWHLSYGDLVVLQVAPGVYLRYFSFDIAVVGPEYIFHEVRIAVSGS